MKLILVRHAEKDVNGLLSDKGKWQTKRLATYLSDEKITALFCSPSPRCEQTMDEIIKNRDELSDIRFSKLIDLKTKGETYSELNRRVSRFVEDLHLEFGEDDTILVVSHNLVIRMFVYYLAKEEAMINEASVTIFTVNEKDSKKIVINETGFLE